MSENYWCFDGPNNLSPRRSEIQNYSHPVSLEIKTPLLEVRVSFKYIHGRKKMLSKPRQHSPDTKSLLMSPPALVLGIALATWPWVTGVGSIELPWLNGLGTNSGTPGVRLFSLDWGLNSFRERGPASFFGVTGSGGGGTDMAEGGGCWGGGWKSPRLFLGWNSDLGVFWAPGTNSIPYW